MPDSQLTEISRTEIALVLLYEHIGKLYKGLGFTCRGPYVTLPSPQNFRCPPRENVLEQHVYGKIFGKSYFACFWTVAVHLIPQVAQAHYESREQHYPP